jgi:hypothetical protein
MVRQRANLVPILEISAALCQLPANNGYAFLAGGESALKSAIPLGYIDVLSLLISATYVLTKDGPMS